MQADQSNSTRHCVERFLLFVNIRRMRFFSFQKVQYGIKVLAWFLARDHRKYFKKSNKGWPTTEGCSKNLVLISVTFSVRQQSSDPFISWFPVFTHSQPTGTTGRSRVFVTRRDMKFEKLYSG